MKLTPTEEQAVIKTKQSVKKNADGDPRSFDWWNANSKRELCEQVLSTANYLKKNQQYRLVQAARYAMLYGNMPLVQGIGSNYTRMTPGKGQAKDRPTMNVVQSCIDTLVSRVTQSKPRPVFLTDNGDHKMRTLAEDLNQFIEGEFYQTHAYKIGARNLTDSGILGTGCVQVYEDTTNKKVALDRVLQTDLYVDQNDALYGNPRQLHRLKLIDRNVLEAHFPEARSLISKAMESYPDASAESTQTVSDQVMVAESWHLPSGKGAKDGMHTIVCSAGIILDEIYEKDKFPFAFMHYSPRPLGFWGQPLAEQLMGTQTEINALLMTISKSINLMGVPRIFVESGSKVVPAHFNNEIGAIVHYTGTIPQFVTAPCIAPEIYDQLNRLIQYAYQQSGVSALSAQAQKPAGINSGAALREYDDLQTDRFASLVRRYDEYYIDLAYLMIDKAKDIAERDGSYETIYPGKDGIRKLDFKQIPLLDNPYVIQCYDSSSLPKDPAGRKEYVVEMMQAGIYSPQEGRRLLNFSDTAQVDKLENAAEERILKVLDDIVEDGKYTPPDEFMDLQLASKLVVQYYNLYVPAKLSDARAEQLRLFKKQIEDIIAEATPPPMPMAPGGTPPPGGGSPIANPQAPPVSDLLPVS